MRRGLGWLFLLAGCGDEPMPVGMTAAPAAVAPAETGSTPRWDPGTIKVALPTSTETSIRPLSRPSRILIVEGADGGFEVATDRPPARETVRPPEPSTTPVYARLDDGATTIVVFGDVNAAAQGLLNGLATVVNERTAIAVARQGGGRLAYVFGRPSEIKRASIRVEVAPQELDVFGTKVAGAEEAKEIERLIAEKRRVTSMAIEPELALRSDVSIKRLVEVITMFEALGVVDLKLVRSSQPAVRPGSSGTSFTIRDGGIPTVSFGTATVTGDLDKAIVRRYLKRNQQKLAYCYEKQLLARGNFGGTITTRFTIQADGRVAGNSAQGTDAVVAACFAQVIGAIEFPKPGSGGAVTVRFPFVLRPSGE